MEIKNYTYIAQRQTAGYGSHELYINVNSFLLFRKYYDLNKKGVYDTVNVKLIDKLLGKFTLNLKQQPKSKSEFWLKTLGDYIKASNLQPGDIMTLTVIKEKNDFSFYIKADRYYRYVLAKDGKINKYRLLIESPPRLNKEGMTDSTEDYLSGFNIIKTSEKREFSNGGKTKFTVWDVPNPGTKYIGVPFLDTELEYFNKIEEVL